MRRAGGLPLVLPLVLVDLARNHLPAALVHQHGRVGQETGGVHAGHGRAHQQGRPLGQGCGQAVQSPPTTARKIFGAEVVPRSHAAEGQFRRDAELGPGGGRLAGGFKDAFRVAGHVAGDAVAL